MKPVVREFVESPFQLISQAKVDTKKTSQHRWNVLVMEW